MVEHDMSVVFDLADRISVLVYGEVIAHDTPERIRANAQVQEAYLGVPRRRLMLDVTTCTRTTARATSCTASPDVTSGEMSACWGRNGVGRSTTIKAIMGDVHAEGSIRFTRRGVCGLPPLQIAHQGPGLRAGAPRHLSDA
jgi:ABC-type branched-subunit amino acid transport system ATPase component